MAPLAISNNVNDPNAVAATTNEKVELPEPLKTPAFGNVKAAATSTSTYWQLFVNHAVNLLKQDELKASLKEQYRTIIGIIFEEVQIYIYITIALIFFIFVLLLVILLILIAPVASTYRLYAPPVFITSSG
jgi:hypothetical protein